MKKQPPIETRYEYISNSDKSNCDINVSLMNEGVDQ